MYKRTPFRDRAIDAMKSMEPESTMSTDGESGGGGLFPKLREKRQQRRAARGLNKKGTDAETTRRSDVPQEDFEMYIEEGGATTSRPDNEVGMTRRGLRDKIKRIRQGGSTGFVYDESGTPLFGKQRRQVIRDRVKKARQDFRNQA